MEGRDKEKPSTTAPCGAAGNEKTDEVISYLTLGDGDFSYSLDLCRYLSASLVSAPTSHGGKDTKYVPSSDAANELGGMDGRQSSFAKSRKRDHASNSAISIYRICCTGIDSLPNLMLKYKDSDFILRRLRKLDRSRPCSKGRERKKPKLSPDSASFDLERELQVVVCHGVNAIIGDSDGSDTGSKSRISGRFDHVVFNHPHLGTESASLHTRFLSHLFHSAIHHWMSNPGGVLHLTLAKGQVERWKCLETAERMGLILLHRGEFRPPPAPLRVLRDASALADKKKRKNLSTTYYQHRRHQCGRSFASRATGGSETVTLGRVSDKGTYAATHLPWQLFPDESVSLFECPHCSKVFKEERACKDHIRGVHIGSGNVKSTGESKACFIGLNVHECALCFSDDGMQEKRRVFASAQALADHKRAKHSGPHTDIKPDWFNRRKGGSSVGDEQVRSIATSDESHCPNAGPNVVIEEEHVGTSFDECSICKQAFANENEMASHLKQFTPNNTFGASEKKPFRCRRCSKEFREKRAQMQHENVCSSNC